VTETLARHFEARGRRAMDGATAYLENIATSSTSEDESEDERRVGFAALAVVDDARDDESERDDDGCRAGSDENLRAATSGSSSTTSDSSEEHEETPFPEDATADELVAAVSSPDAHGANVWSWSTGRAGAGEVRVGQTPRAKRKKAFLMQGEKTALKNRHVEETRARRSEKRCGFTPFELKTTFEEFHARARWNPGTIWSPPRGFCGSREARFVKALVSCFPRLEYREAKRTKKKVFLDVVAAGTCMEGAGALDDDARGGNDPTDDMKRRAEALSAPVPSRDEFLKDPSRLAKVSEAFKKKSAARSREDTGGRKPRVDPGRRGTGARHAPNTSRTTRRARANDLSRGGVHSRNAPDARSLAETFSSLGIARAETGTGTRETGTRETGTIETGTRETGSGSGLETRLRLATTASPALENFGAFERHTSGFGGRMLRRMGHEPGEGLGKEKKGVAEPIEARPRPRRLGLGLDEYTAEL